MELKDMDKIELFSEEVQELMGKPPSKIIRSGIIILLTTILGIIGLSFFIRYPDTISGPVNIYSTNPPALIKNNLVSELSLINVSENKRVTENEMLAVLADSSNYEIIKKLKNYIFLLDTIMSNGKLDLKKIPVYDIRNLGALQVSFLKLRKIIIQSKSQLSNNDKSDYYSRIGVIQGAIEEIKLEITIWEKRNLLISPLSGTIKFTRKLVKNSILLPGELVFIIYPISKQQFIATITLPVSNYKQVKVGQEVGIKILNYPENEFGSLKGKIESIDFLTTKDLITAIVSMPNGLKTNTEKVLTFIPNLKVEGVIILQNLSLGQRILGSIKGFFRQ